MLNHVKSPLLLVESQFFLAKKKNKKNSRSQHLAIPGGTATAAPRTSTGTGATVPGPPGAAGRHGV